MTKIDSAQNTPELMDVSVIDINTRQRDGASPVGEKKAQSAPIRGDISVSCVIRVSNVSGKVEVDEYQPNVRCRTSSCITPSTVY